MNNNEKKDGKEKEKKVVRYSLRMTVEEHKQIQDKAFESHKSLNDYIKTSALDKDIIVVEGLKDLTLEIKRIGVNINQITKNLNAGNILTDEEKLYMLEVMDNIWQRLKLYTAQNP